eukprot:TRINITY_DN15691_c0_g1_i2.p1 TRINITY_DN15691_c0_g1~~TRINITY_DN15691_c0_g1_i2.p1  ORF type:complete len:319 (+),score=52.63 TRINITY_DN15691_c0_g1_i2:568-1524(+)
MNIFWSAVRTLCSFSTVASPFRNNDQRNVTTPSSLSVKLTIYLSFCITTWVSLTIVPLLVVVGPGGMFAGGGRRLLRKALLTKQHYSSRVGMELNSDLSKGVVVESGSVEWVGSQMKGVERRMLERKGDEVAVCATIVKYERESYYDEHGHDEGEEFLVLEGIFSDNYGDFPAGTYVRNPPGSRHKPHTKDGCTIFVRLRQFQPDDQSFTRTNILESTDWEPTPTAGVTALPLHKYGSETVSIVKIAPQAAFTTTADRIEELLVIAGAFTLKVGDAPPTPHPPLTWMRHPAGTPVTITASDNEVTVLRREGRSRHPDL